jgi:hypothetical protein
VGVSTRVRPPACECECTHVPLYPDHGPGTSFGARGQRPVRAAHELRCVPVPLGTLKGLLAGPQGLWSMLSHSFSGEVSLRQDSRTTGCISGSLRHLIDCHAIMSPMPYTGAPSLRPGAGLGSSEPLRGLQVTLHAEVPENSPSPSWGADSGTSRTSGPFVFLILGPWVCPISR